MLRKSPLNFIYLFIVNSNIYKYDSNNKNKEAHIGKSKKYVTTNNFTLTIKI